MSRPPRTSYLVPHSSFLVLAAGGALFLLLRDLLPTGYDFYYWYRPIPLAWLAGETRLYDAASAGFYSPPWVIWLLLPFALLDFRSGMAALALSSAAIVAGVALAYTEGAAVRRRAAAATLAVLCPYTLNVLMVGTLDAWSLLGAYLGYRAVRGRCPWLLGAGVLLLMTKPQHAFLLAPVLVLSVRAWPPVLLLKAAALPGLVLALSGAAFGWDWPVRWWRHFTELPPRTDAGYLITSTYDLFLAAGLPLALGIALAALVVALAIVRIRGRLLDFPEMDLAMTVNAIAVPYMLSQSYLALLAMPWARLAVRRPWLAALLYLVSLPVLIRAQGLWDRLGLLDITFPLLLLVTLLLCGRPAQAVGASGSGQSREALADDS